MVNCDSSHLSKAAHRTYWNYRQSRALLGVNDPYSASSVHLGVSKKRAVFLWLVSEKCKSTRILARDQLS